MLAILPKTVFNARFKPLSLHLPTGTGKSLSPFWLVFGWLALVSPAFAQQTIFNVPSADVTPKESVYLETESQFRPWAPNRFWLGTQYFAYGIGHGAEIDVTLSVSSPASGNIALGGGFKKIFLISPQRFPKREFKLTVGEIVPVSLQGQGVGSWTYSHLSGRIPRLNGRITAGVSVGTRQLFGRNTAGFIGGFEQPVTKRFTLIADWFSGTHANGYFIPGFSYVISGPTTLFVGYQLPNTHRVGPQGLVIELSTIAPTRRQPAGAIQDSPSPAAQPSGSGTFQAKAP